MISALQRLLLLWSQHPHDFPDARAPPVEPEDPLKRALRRRVGPLTLHDRLATARADEPGPHEDKGLLKALRGVQRARPELVDDHRLSRGAS